MEDKIWYLSQINVLKDLSKDQLMQLGGQCSMVTYKRGDKLYLPGTANDIFFLKTGSIKIVSHAASGQELISEVLHFGEIFGKIAGESVGNTQESAIALEDSVVCFLPYSQWQEFVSNHLSLNFKLLKWMGFLIKRLERKMDLLYFKDARTRVVELLVDLARRMGKPEQDTTEISAKLTHEEIAQLTGNSRQSVTTILNSLREEGLIDYDRNKIKVKNSVIEKQPIA